MVDSYAFPNKAYYKVGHSFNHKEDAMRSFKHLLIGVLGITFIVGMVMVGPPADMHAASGTALFGSVSIGDTGGKCEVPPAWTGPIRGKDRWVPTYIDKYGKPHAYCDRQTGLVLQATPGEPPDDECRNTGGTCSWNDARFYCANLTVGDSGQKGWRLLYMPELAALVDTNSKSCTEDDLCLPDGHPFKDVQAANYWSASASAVNPALVWRVDFEDGVVGFQDRSGDARPWCGRGASAADAY